MGDAADIIHSVRSKIEAGVSLSEAETAFVVDVLRYVAASYAACERLSYDPNCESGDAD